MSTMYNPVSTYRVQLHKDFTLAALEKQIPYLQSLGIRTVYASPVFEAVPGSMHGYDGVNPLRINPEIGTEDDLRRISGALHELGIGWLQDIVPNHMAFDQKNAWLMDVLRNGPESEFASYFDIDSQSGGRLMVPILGDTLENVISKGELKLVNGDGTFLEYGGHRFPLRAGSYPEQFQAADLKKIADAQHYRLCHWQETDHTINYRRFFTVNGLICLNIQDATVFNHVHQRIAALVADGVFDGLRVDHIDGLYDPTTYLERLRALCGGGCYIVVEKILQPGESIPRRWPIAGTTGYDFLGLVNNLMTKTEARRAFTRGYHALTGDTESPELQAHKKKRHILEAHMQGELANLTRIAHSLLPETGESALREALAGFLIYCPVYRYYANTLPVAADEARELRKLFQQLRNEIPERITALNSLEALLLTEPAGADDERREKTAHLYRRMMQYSGPLMAKGVEDTLMYTYGRAIVHNEVGDAPESFGISVEAFHRAMLERQQHWPLAQNASATHDTKRGEDARSLLQVLPQVPSGWFAAVREWRHLNAPLRDAGGPDDRDEYFIYQTLFASYPLLQAELCSYPERLEEYLRKALREGKRRSDWARPDEAYENATIGFAKSLLQPENRFLERFQQFRNGLVAGGLLLALSQLTLKFCCPGVPDVYQGTELWDLSLVDPDNRRPVDYEMRNAAITAAAAAPGAWPALWESREDGKVKLWLMKHLLQLRSEHQELFRDGHYVPLRVVGRQAQNLIAFARRHRENWILVVVPIGLSQDGRPLNGHDWNDTRVMLPAGTPAIWNTGAGAEPGIQSGQALMARDLFRGMPIAILSGSTPTNRRSAGILMAVTSLPGAFGVGDLGPEARRFARSLSRAGQRIWQLLPLNLVSAGSGFSPYSSASTMAGNTMLISPERLVEIGLIDQEELDQFRTAQTHTVDYEAALQLKKAVLDLAFTRYVQGNFAALRQQIDTFYEQEKFWLDDFAHYTIIKSEQSGAAWYEWPQAVRSPRSSDVQRIRHEHSGSFDRIIWEQALFSMQWRELRSYCNGLGLQLVGDLPFYLSYDSADVWANQALFSLDEAGKMTGVAGVPPDYFSETGQLWGMPTFNWKQHRESSYDWWTARLRRNLELYDLLRIDHFRALAEYWEVPAGEDTAVNGKWLPGPGTAFFDALRDSLGKLPFIAEDLGDNMDKVYELRDAVRLPGMKVMQFAFGDNLPQSVDAPHNYPLQSVCYTGTHDNNTTLGWFRTETSAGDRRRIDAYTGTHATEQNINALMARLVFASVSERAVLPMQDILNLDETHRMNMPAAGEGNWRWRMRPGVFDEARIKALFELTQFYNRL